MRSSWKTLAAVATSLVLVPQLAAATTDVEDQIRQMQERMSRMEDSLQATNDQLASANETVAEQQALIEKAGLEDRGAESSLSKFLSDTEFSGAVAASYFYNFNKPENFPAAGFGPTVAGRPVSGPGGAAALAGAGNGQNQISNPFHPNANTFAFDEFSLNIGRAATADMPAGFQADLMFGETADTIVNGGLALNNGGGNQVFVRQAYVEYMTPMGPTLTLGKFDTLIGYETVGQAENFNVTRGFTYNLLQPISQVGVLLGQSYDGGLHWTIGAVNGIGANQPDIDQQKDITWSLGWSGDTASVSVNGLYGWDVEGTGAALVQNLPSTEDDYLTLDLILELTPSDAFTAWVNVTSLQVFLDKRYQGGGVAPVANAVGKNPWAVGVNVGGHVAIIPDKAGVAIRYEFLHADTDSSGLFDAAFATPLTGPLLTGVDLHGVTGTIDYALTEALTLKVEVKWEQARLRGGALGLQLFPENGGITGFKNGTRSQVIAGAQMLYEF